MVIEEENSGLEQERMLIKDSIFKLIEMISQCRGNEAVFYDDSLEEYTIIDLLSTLKTNIEEIIEITECFKDLEEKVMLKENELRKVQDQLLGSTRKYEESQLEVERLRFRLENDHENQDNFEELVTEKKKMQEIVDEQSQLISTYCKLLEEEKDKNNDTVHKMCQNAKEKDDKISKLEENIKKLKKEIEEKDKKLLKNSEDIKNLENSLDCRSETVRERDQELKKIQKKFQNLQKENSEMKKKLKKIEDELEEVSNRNFDRRDKLEKTVWDQQNLIEIYENKINDQEKELRRIFKENSFFKQRADKYDKYDRDGRDGRDEWYRNAGYGFNNENIAPDNLNYRCETQSSFFGQKKENLVPERYLIDLKMKVIELENLYKNEVKNLAQKSKIAKSFEIQNKFNESKDFNKYSNKNQILQKFKSVMSNFENKLYNIENRIKRFD